MGATSARSVAKKDISFENGLPSMFGKQPFAVLDVNGVDVMLVLNILTPQFKKYGEEYRT